MGERGEHIVEPVDPAATIAAELIDALANAFSSLGLYDRVDSSPDESAPVLATT
ncbi:MAG: hypothetical protein KDB37_12390 [Ilumatobacter sp.]|nr:hypothetical protein [Ilumatobacter sp.]